MSDTSRKDRRGSEQLLTTGYQSVYPEALVRNCGIRVGSSFAIQYESSFSFGAENACEFEAVKSVKVNRL